MTSSLLILTPSLGKVSLGYRDTFAHVTLECHKRGIRLEVADDTTSGFLGHARNCLYMAAVHSTCRDVLWWDSDVSFDPAFIFDLLERPELDAGDLVCRPYPLRRHDFAQVRDYVLERQFVKKVTGLTPEALEQASYRWSTQVIHDERGQTIWSADQRLLQVFHCGFGWVLSRVDAMRAFLSEADPRPIYPVDWRNRPACSLFDFLQKDEGHPLACEDAAFCIRWREARRRIWAAPGCVMRNGEMWGSFGDYLAREGFAP